MLRPSFTIAAPASRMAFPAGKITCHRPVNRRKNKVMGDKSPKANQKMSGQKDSKTSSTNAKKSSAQAAKSSAGKKK
jgi:hypothetical protein